MEVDNKYLVILHQTIHTTIPVKINRIEIGKLVGITDKTYVLETETCKRWIKKSLVKGFINLDSIHTLNALFYFDKLESLLQ